MKNKKLREIVGLSAFVSALSLCITFIVLAIRKKSVWQAILAIAAAEGAVGAAMLLTKDYVKSNTKPADLAEEDSVIDDELFDDEEVEEAELHVRSVLGGSADGETAGAPSARREVPRDEEATEEDFL